jgi:hypothetical protein
LEDDLLIKDFDSFFVSQQRLTGNKRRHEMKSHIITWMLAGLIAQSVQAEIRTWTGNTGSQIQAELVKEAAGKVILRDETGKERKVPRSFLSPVDIEYLDSLIVPTLGINPDVKVESEFKSGAGVVQVVKYTIEIRKVSSDPYESPVNIELYLIGTIGDDTTYVVLHRTKEQVRFTAGTRNPKITGPDLSLGSPELQKKYDVDYVGYLIIASSAGGQIIEVQSDKKIIEANAGFISKFKAGDLFGSDMKPIE